MGCVTSLLILAHVLSPLNRALCSQMNPRIFVDNLKNACSDIDPQWQEHLDFWEGEEPGYYNEISVIVHYIMSKHKASDFRDFDDIAKIIDLGLKSKNDETSELALIGVLEGILFVGSHDDIRPEHHKNWLSEFAYKELVELEDAFEELQKKLSNKSMQKWTFRSWLSSLRSKF